MIQKIVPREADVTHLLSRSSVPVSAGNKPDYRNVVVNKPWGYEYLMFENSHVAIWVLFLKDGAKTSMHCHPKKRTSLLVLGGKVITSSLSDQFPLDPLHGVVIDRGAFHSTASEHEEGSFVMEIENPVEKSDLVRLNDTYGRENKGYESGENISNDLEQYEHHAFHHVVQDNRSINEKKIRQSTVVLHVNEEWDRLREEIAGKGACVLSFLDTSIIDGSGDTVLAIGEICTGAWFLEQHSALSPQRETFTALAVY